MTASGLKAFRSGFVAIVGKPNVGKSTLVNYLLGRKIAPVSRKPQTTRQVIHGIRSEDDSQMIFVDTPGIHQPADPLGKLMVATAKKSFGSADLVYFMVEPRIPDADDERVLKAIESYQGPVFLLVNKVDLLEDKQRMLPVIDAYQKQFPFKEIIPISALRGVQCDVLIEKTKEFLPDGPRYFPEDMITSEPVSEVVKELVREKVVRFTGEEIPYVTAVTLDEMKTRQDGLVEIRATVIVDKESQKGILIGKGGSKMKQIGQAARRSLELFLNHKVYLGLWVKVVPGWKKDPRRLRQFGYE